jgi:hypothetical protein
MISASGSYASKLATLYPLVSGVARAITAVRAAGDALLLM